MQAWNCLLIIQERNRDFESSPRHSFLVTEVTKSGQLKPRQGKESRRRTEAQDELIDHENENDLFSSFWCPQDTRPATYDSADNAISSLTFLLFYAYVCALTSHHEPLLTRANLCCSLYDIKKYSTSVVHACRGHWEPKLLPTSAGCGVIQRTALQIQRFKTPTTCASAAEHCSNTCLHVTELHPILFTANPPDVCPHMRKKLRLARCWLLQLECTSPHSPTGIRERQHPLSFFPRFQGQGKM
jgi:hypothetical protein